MENGHPSRADVFSIRPVTSHGYYTMKFNIILK